MTRIIGAVIATCLLLACDNPAEQAEATQEKHEVSEKVPAERQVEETEQTAEREAEAIKQNAAEAERHAAETAKIEAAIAACEYIKTIQAHGGSAVAVYINSDFPRKDTFFLAAAEKHFRDSDYVYFFTDRDKAKTWNPTDHGPGRQHDSVIGRVYLDDDYREYSPPAEWISLSP